VRDLDIAAGDKGVFGFGPFLLDPLRRRMTLDGDVVKLPPIQFDTLWVPLWGGGGGGGGRGWWRWVKLNAVWYYTNRLSPDS
jgi:hypothetical protein